jgi:hypothetical protein
MADATIGKLKAVLEADTSAYSRAMADATADVQKLSASLQKDLEPRQKAVNAAIRDFLGGTEIRKAQEYAEAVRQMGGVAALTAQDQAKVNAAVEEAIGHYQALGAQAPQHLVELERATKGAVTVNEGLIASVKQLLPALGIGFSVAAVVNFGKSLVEDASHIKDVSEKLGISVEATQRYSYALQQTGGSIDDLGGAINKMNQNLAGGSDSTVAALTALGLSFEDLRQMRPEDAFGLIIEAIRKIPDPMKRAQVVMELFGRTGSNLLPGIEEGLIQIGEQADVMSDKTVSAFDDFGDAIDRVYSKLRARAATSLTGDLFQSFQDQFLEMLPAGLRNQVKSSAAFRDALNNGTLPTPSNPLPTGGGGALAVPEDAKRQFDDFSRSAQKAIDAAEQYRKEIEAMARTMVGADLPDKVKKIADALKLAGGLTSAQFDVVGKQLDQLVQQGAILTPELSELWRAWAVGNLTLKDVNTTLDLHLKSLKLVGPEYDELTAQFMHFVKVGSEAQDFIFKNLPNKIKEGGLQAVPTEFQKWDTALRGVADDFVRLSQVAGPALATVTRDIGTAVVAIDQFAKAGQLVGKGKGLLSNISGITGEIGAGIELGALAYDGLKKVFHNTAGRDLINSFADSQGGFDALHQKLDDEFGAMGESVWKSFTQGIANGDKAAAQRAIDAITKGFTEIDRLNGLLASDFTTLTSKLSAFGGVAPKSLQPIIADLLSMNGLTAEQKALLEQLGGDPSLDALKAAADDLGVSFDHMGQAFKDAQIDALAFKYQHELDLLRDSGADMNNVLTDSKDKLNALVQQALASGTSLPKTLEPYIQKLADMGLLLGPDGLPQDISKLTFADIEDQPLNDIKQILADIRDLLANKIPAAAQQAANALANVKPPFDPATDGGTQPPAGPGVSTPNTGDDSDSDGYPDYLDNYPYDFTQHAAGAVLTRPTRIGPRDIGGEGGQPEIIGPVSFISKALTQAILNLGLDGAAFSAGAVAQPNLSQPLLDMPGLLGDLSHAPAPVAALQTLAANAQIHVVLEQDRVKTAEWILPAIPGAAHRLGLSGRF